MNSAKRKTEHMDWHKQSSDQPLYENLFWSRPENKAARGKLLIVGGNKYGFAAPAQAYMAAQSAGSGDVRAVLPNAIQKLVGGFFEHAIFTASTPSGSLSNQSMSDLLAASQWSDGVLLAGDVGKNAETTVALESFARHYPGTLVATRDSISLLQAQSTTLLDRPKTVLVVTMQQLQKLATNSKFAHAFTFDMPQQQLIERLAILSKNHPAAFVLKRLKQVYVAVDGKVSVTQIASDKDVWRVELSAYASVWAIQQPQKPFEALTCSVFAFFNQPN